MKRLKRKLRSLVLRVKRWLIEKLGGKLCSRSCDLYISRIEVVERLIPNPDKIRADVTLYGKPWSFQHDESEIRYEMSKRMVKWLMENDRIKIRTEFNPELHETRYMGELLVIPPEKEKRT